MFSFDWALSKSRLNLMAEAIKQIPGVKDARVHNEWTLEIEKEECYTWRDIEKRLRPVFKVFYEVDRVHFTKPRPVQSDKGELL